ncbi:hypothetical protein [Bartonella sp. TT29SHDZB]|uniref:hypothetical protein n=1 Tax=Bartonella sp. TT29SHDZB TaxID=3243581 RepID=UPI0035D05C77
MLNELIIERITEEGALKNGENPPYFGEFVVEDIIVKLGLSVPETAEWFEMVRVSVLHMLGSLYKKNYDFVQAFKHKYPKDISSLYMFLSLLKCLLKARQGVL